MQYDTVCRWSDTTAGKVRETQGKHIHRHTTNAPMQHTGKQTRADDGRSDGRAVITWHQCSVGSYLSMTALVLLHSSFFFFCYFLSSCLVVPVFLLHRFAVRCRLHQAVLPVRIASCVRTSSP